MYPASFPVLVRYCPDRRKEWPGGRTGRKGQRLFADIFQTLRTIFICQFQHTEIGFIALLLNLVTTENRSNYSVGMRSNLRCPFAEAVTVPLDILLMVLRHMAFCCAVLVCPAVKPGMEADPVAAEKHFNSGFCNSDIHLLLDIFVGNRVIHLLHADMVIVANGSDLPCRQLIRSGRQRHEECSLLRKQRRTATIFLLERLVVKLVQSFLNCLIQFPQGKKSVVSECCQDECRDNTHGSLHHGFVLG